MSWRMPDGFPSLAGAKGIGIDLETYDPHLLKMGSGARRDGFIIGVSIATDDLKFQQYYPIKHQGGQNFNQHAVMDWLKEELGRPKQRKYFFNGQYDLDYLAHYGVNVPSEMYCDPMLAEPLIDENKFEYSLDSQSQQYLGKKKSTQLLIDAAKKANIKIRKDDDVYLHLRDLPLGQVAQYAIDDIVDTIKIFHKQVPLLKQEGVWDVYMMEQGLIPLLIQMKQNGVRVDQEALPKAIAGMEKELKEAKKKLRKIAGYDMNVYASDTIYPAFDAAGIAYPLTAKTKAPSFTKKWLEKQQHPLPQALVEVRQIDKLLGTFLKGAISSHSVDGRIHCQFNQLKSDMGGTGTGRFSAANPNLQQVPKRSSASKIIRQLFIPEEGHIWVKADYAQIEVRMLAHFALGRGAEAFRQYYRDYPNKDYHEWVAELAGIDREPAKTINFAIIYGQGIKATALALGISYDEAKALLDQYFGALPFVKYTRDKASDVASARGYVKTILGRKRHYPFWGASDRRLYSHVSPSRDQGAVSEAIREAIQSLHEQQRTMGRVLEDYQIGVSRYKPYTALNSVLQGSAGDLIKMAMLKSYQAGIFNTLVPHLTVHDELDVSMPESKAGRQAVEEMCHIMRTAIDFSVPILVDPEFGPNWGDVHGE